MTKNTLPKPSPAIAHLVKWNAAKAAGEPLPPETEAQLCFRLWFESRPSRRNKEGLTYYEYIERTGLAPCGYTTASLAMIYWKEDWSVSQTIKFFKIPWYRHVQWVRKLLKQDSVMFR